MDGCETLLIFNSTYLYQENCVFFSVKYFILNSFVPQKHIIFWYLIYSKEKSYIFYVQHIEFVICVW